MDDRELAGRVPALVERFAGRLDAGDFDSVSEYARVGEWGEAVDLLAACLAHDGRAVTREERDEFAGLLVAMGMSTAWVDGLNVTG